MKKKLIRRFISGLFTVLLTANLLFAQSNNRVSPDVPRIFDYQGILTNAEGNPYNGSFDITFAIINTNDQSVLFEELVENLQVTNGLIHHLIGSAADTLDPFIFQNATALRIKVNDETLSPDILIAPAPVALVALYADSLKHPISQDVITSRINITSDDTAIVVRTTSTPAIYAEGGVSATKQNLSKNGSSPSRLLTNDEPPGAIHGVGNGDNPGVLGESETGTGVMGRSVEGFAVGGHSDNGWGVLATTRNGMALAATAMDPDGIAAEFTGKVNIYGELSLNDGKTRIDTAGEIYAKSLHTDDGSGNLTSGVNTQGEADYKKVTVPTLAGRTEINNLGIYHKDGQDNITDSWNYVEGVINTRRIIANQKNAAAATENYGKRLFYCDESTEVMFFDRGQGRLLNGEVTIHLDPMFLETVTIDDVHPMLVQVTLTSDCNGVYIAEKTTTSFTVKELMNGTSDASFDWEVAAKRRGYESIRMEEF